MHGLSESRFNMWRAVIVMAHADAIVKPHEIHFILENTKDLSMTEAQRAVLVEDFKNPAAMQSVFENITSPRDKEDFFHFARAMCWSDGDFDDAEKALLDQLRNITLKAEDRKALEASLAHFKGVYVDGTEQANDPGLFDMIRMLMSAKAA